MEYRAYFAPLMKWWWLILAAAVLAAGTSFVIVRNQPPVYTSKTTLLIGRTVSNPNPSSNDFWLSQQLASLYADIAFQEPVQSAVMKDLGLDWLPNYVVKPIGNSQFIEIDVVDTIPQRAQRVASELARQLIALSPSGAQAADATQQAFNDAQINDLQQQITQTQDQIAQKQADLGGLQSAIDIAQAQQDLQALQSKLTVLQTNYANMVSSSANSAANILEVIEPATLPSIPEGPSKYLIIAIAGVIGLVLAGGASYLLEYLDDTLRTPSDVIATLKVPAIGYFADLGQKKFGSGPYVQEHPRSMIAEAYRSLRASLEFPETDRPLKTILITSPDTQDGKTSVAINLALSIMQGGKTVILVDGDLRKPSVHTYLDLPEAMGLGELLNGSAKVDKCLKKWGNTKLLVLTAGNPTNHLPDELLTPDKIEDFLSALKERADVIIIDSSPFLVSDAMILAAKVDGVLLVVRPGHTHKEMARAMLEKVTRAGANIVGVVLNRIPIRQIGYYSDYRYYSPYYYSKYGPDDNGHSNGKTNGKLQKEVAKGEMTDLLDQSSHSDS